jgi:uncharacterized SAM-binding protein YcdF (DUF218 family)
MIGGFVVFVRRAADFEAAAPGGADGVVVLTGGADRIDAGAQLVAQKRGARLLISGVNEKVTREDMLALYPQLRPLNGCCLDLGYRALSTVGNALETREWAERHGFRSLILVTAASHLPRALAEFAHAMPHVGMAPLAAGGERLDMVRWWTDPTLLRILGVEYAKYMLAAARIAVEPAPGRWWFAGLREPDAAASRR